MHNILQIILPHLFFLVVLFSIPPQYALYVFCVFYIAGIYINYQKDKKLAEKENMPKSNTHEWWEVLGTHKTASLSECARVRKLLTKIYHPDGGQAANAEHMRRINQAYEEKASLPENVPSGFMKH